MARKQPSHSKAPFPRWITILLFLSVCICILAGLLDTSASFAPKASSNADFKPQRLARGDFDEDGVPDVVAGYSGNNNGFLKLYLGNHDWIYPNSPNAQKHRSSGNYIDAPFIASATNLPTRVPVDFLATGDFDNDGHIDAVFGGRGGDVLYFVLGDGHGRFPRSAQIQLEGRLTALASGEINRPDGIADLAVGIDRGHESQVIVYESPDGVLKASSETYQVSAHVNSLALGQIDPDYSADLAIASGNQVMVVHGRDRKLSFNEQQRSQAGPAVIDEHGFGSNVVSMEVGRFTDQPEAELAVLLNDGTIRGLSVEKSTLRSREILSLPADTSLDNVFVLNGRALSIEGEVADVLPMRLNGDALDDVVILKSGQSSLEVSVSEASSTFTVTNTNDSGPGSLRQALLDANNNVGLDNISFAIPGAGVHTISPLSPLPLVTDPVTIDGTTQPGFAGVPLIELDGS